MFGYFVICCIYEVKCARNCQKLTYLIEQNIPLEKVFLHVTWILWIQKCILFFAARSAAAHRSGLMRREAPHRTATDLCGAKRRSAPRRTHAARSAAAAAGASEVRVSAPIELRQWSGGAAPGKFFGDFTL